jgi:hypothetical protein
VNRLDDTLELEVPARTVALRPRVPTGGAQVDVAGLWHPGKVRPNNQDQFLIARFGPYEKETR